MMYRMSQIMERMDRMMQMYNDMMDQMQQERAETAAESDARQPRGMSPDRIFSSTERVSPPIVLALSRHPSCCSQSRLNGGVDMHVREIMTENPGCCASETKLGDVAN